MDNTVFNVRPARNSDLEAIKKCISGAYEPHIRRIGKRPASLDRDFSALIERGAVYVHENENALIGTFVLEQDGESIEVSSVAVDPSAQGQGIGRMLMKVAEAKAIERGGRSMRLYTNAALSELVSYYEKLGYTVSSTQFDEGFDRVFMEKKLLTDA